MSLMVIIMMILESPSFVSILILAESSMVISIMMILLKYDMNDSNAENFTLMFLSLMIIESSIALFMSISLCKKTSGDLLDNLLFY